MATDKPTLRSLTDIYSFLSANRMPIYFVTPVPFNLLGLDQWVGGLEYITYFDSFDGYHPRVFTPQETGPREFRSMEEVGNYLLANEEAVAHFRSRGKAGKVMLVMFDEEAEELVRGLGFEMALPSAKLRTHIDSRITTTRRGNAAGVPSAPNTMGRASTFAELMALAEQARLGQDLVVQTPYGDSGRTFFIRNEDDWARRAPKLLDEELKV